MRKKKISFGVSYYGNHFPWHFEKDLLEMKQAGISHIVYAASEYELSFYLPSTAEFYKIARKQKIKFFINFWAHGNAFGGEGGSFFATENPDAWQTTSKNRKVSSVCFNHPEFLDFMLKQVRKVSGICDGVFFDEPAFYSDKRTNEEGCFCEICKKKFKKKFHKEMKNTTKKELADFRNKSLIVFVDKLAKEYKNKNKKGITIVCLYPAQRDETLSWEDFLKLKSIDVFGSDPYWKDPAWHPFIIREPDFVHEVGQKIVEKSNIHKKQSQIWIQNFSIKNPKEVYEAINYAKSCNPDYITAWTYKGACYSELSNKDWKKSWDLLVKAYNNKR